MLKGIDISHWQTGLSIRLSGAQFVIFKLTQGTAFIDNMADNNLKQIRAMNIPYGCYHFAAQGNPEDQADFFVREMKERAIIGKALPVLDYEVTHENDAKWVERWAQRFYNATKIWPVIYTSASWCKKFQNSWVPQKCALWVAGYHNPTRSTYEGNSDYRKHYSVTPWNEAIIWQFTGQLAVSGYTSMVDGDFCYIDAKQWADLAKGANAEPVIDNTLSKIADEVIAGKWGNGKDRVLALERAGYDSAEVQRLVNQKLAPKKKSIDELAREVIAGKWGNGNVRKNALTGAGYDYAVVQRRVNELLK